MLYISLDSGPVKKNRSCDFYYRNQEQGVVSIRKTVLPGMAIPMLKIRRPNGRLIFNMEIAILDKTVFILRRGPGGRLNKKDGLTRYGNSHVKDKTS